MAKLKIAVLMGGPGAEHEVSLNSGRMVLKNLDRKKYSAKPIPVTKRGGWPISFKELKQKFDIVFNALHGEYGEDGTLQKILEKHKIPYTGSGVKASRIGMNKEKSFRLFKKKRLAVPEYTIVSNPKPDLKKLINFGWPIVVKPLDKGSSVGLAITQNRKSLLKNLVSAFSYSTKVILQKYITGRELTCGIIEKRGKAVALPPTEIIPKKRKTFDYYSKYTAGATDEITPPRNMPKNQVEKIRQAALTAHKAVGAKGYSRADFILGNDKKLYILEINTLPGLTKTSLVPQAAKVAGISFPKLLDLIIEAGLK